MTFFNSEPVLECPMIRQDMPNSGIVECKIEDNEGCATEMGEKCCNYGTGQKCIPKGGKLVYWFSYKTSQFKPL